MEINAITNLIINAVEHDHDEFIKCLKENQERGAIESGYYHLLKTIVNEGDFKNLSTGCQAAMLVYIAATESC